MATTLYRRQWLFTVAATGVLVGCGFQLRGQARLPTLLAHTYIDSQRPPGAPPSPLQPVLQRLLVANGVQVVAEPSAHSSRLVLLSETPGQRLISTDAVGDTREYELSYRVNYRVTAADGQLLQAPTAITAVRNIVYRETEVLGSFETTALINRELVNEVAATLLRQLQYLRAPESASLPTMGANARPSDG